MPRSVQEGFGVNEGLARRGQKGISSNYITSHRPMQSSEREPELLGKGGTQKKHMSAETERIIPAKSYSTKAGRSRLGASSSLIMSSVQKACHDVAARFTVSVVTPVNTPVSYSILELLTDVLRSVAVDSSNQQ